MATAFGVVVDEDVVFVVSLAFLSFLSLLWVFIMALILWLRKMHLQVREAVKVVNFRKKRDWSIVNTAFCAYQATDLNEDETHIQQTSFECLEAEVPMNGLEAETHGLRKRLINDIDSTKVVSSNGQSEKNEENREKRIYTSLKNSCDVRYENLREDAGKPLRLADAVDGINRKQEAISISQSSSIQADVTDENDYIVPISDSNDQSIGRNPEVQLKGNGVEDLRNNNVDEAIEINDLENYYENGYLTVIHSASETVGSLESSREDAKLPRQQDEPDYLVPVEGVPLEKQQQNQGNKSKVLPELKHKRNEKGECLTSEKTEESGAHLDYTCSESPGNLRLDSGIITSGDESKPDESREEHNYEYVLTRQVKDWTVSSGNPFKLPERNTSSEAHYVDKGTTFQDSEDAVYSDEYANEYVVVIP